MPDRQDSSSLVSISGKAVLIAKICVVVLKLVILGSSAVVGNCIAGQPVKISVVKMRWVDDQYCYSLFVEYLELINHWIHYAGETYC